MQLVDERSAGVERSEGRSRARIQVHAAVLLGRAGDGGDLCDVDAARQPLHHPVEPLGPHQRRCHADGRVSIRQYAMPGAVVRQRLVEVE
ncbi:hypothetical protein D3C83_14080 [compost metagenome]